MNVMARWMAEWILDVEVTEINVRRLSGSTVEFLI